MKPLSGWWAAVLIVLGTPLMAVMVAYADSKPVPQLANNSRQVQNALSVLEFNRLNSPKHNLTATVEPNAGNDETEGYSSLSIWRCVDEPGSDCEDDASVWLCLIANRNAAVWESFGESGFGIVGRAWYKIIGDSGLSFITADGENDILDLLGGTGITTVLSEPSHERVTFNWAADLGDLGDWPLTTRGDLLYEGAAAPARLAIGTNTHALISDGTDPTWQEIVQLRFFRGIFLESFDALVTSNGTVVTMSLEKSGTGDLTMILSDGQTTFDCTPAATVTLTAGSDASPTENFVYILQNDKILTVSTSDWSTAEHIKVGHFTVPSAAFVQANGVYSNQNINDHASDTGTSLGHLSHIAERIRAQSAIYSSGVDLTVTIGAGPTVDVAVTSGVIYQMHKHATPALDTDTGDVVLVVNQNGANYDDVTDLETLTNDSTGAAVKKYFNWVIWGVGNKGGVFSPLMLNLSNGSYNSQSSAEADVSGYDVLTMPGAFTTNGSTGFLIARVTMSLSGGAWTHVSTVDLRGSTPQSARGGVGPVDTQFSDNAFRVFHVADNTKELAFDVSAVLEATTRTMTVPDQDVNLGGFPASSTNKQLAMFDGTTGKLLAESNFLQAGTSNFVQLAFDADLAVGTLSFDDSVPWFISSVDLLMPATKKLFFRTTDVWLQSSADGELTIEADSLITLDAVTAIPGIGDGGLTNYDLKVGDTTTPDYGMIQFGNALLGRTSYSVGAINLDGAVMLRNIGGPVTGEVEFIFTESVGNTCRLALPKSGVGNATYNPRSMLLAGPAPADTDFVKVSYWQGTGIFDNLVCDTSGTGADFGVQNDVEVEGDIFVDSILESTTASGVTIDSVLVKDGLVDGVDVAAHAFRHQSGGADAIKLDDLAATDDNTDLDSSITAHGLLRKLDNTSTNYLDGTGAWSVPAGGGGGVTLTGSNVNYLARVTGADALDDGGDTSNLGDSTQALSDVDLQFQSSIASGFFRWDSDEDEFVVFDDLRLADFGLDSETLYFGFDNAGTPPGRIYADGLGGGVYELIIFGDDLMSLHLSGGEQIEITSTRINLHNDVGGIVDLFVSGDISVGGTVDGIDVANHTHSASAITSGTLAHERGGLEFDVSAVAIGDIISGSAAGTMALVTSTGHSDGDVLTRQADGSVDYEVIPDKYRRRTHYLEVENPVAGDEFTIAFVAHASTMKEVFGEVDTTTGVVVFNVEERAFGSCETAGTDTLTGDLSGTDVGASSTTFSNSAIAAESCLTLTITSITATPTLFYAAVTYVED